MSSPRSVRQFFDAFRDHARGSQSRAKASAEADPPEDAAPSAVSAAPLASFGSFGPSVSRSPREVLRLYHEAMKAKSADALAELYAPDAVHEFSFGVPNRPSRYEGREALRAGYRQAWEGHPLEIDAIEDVFVHEGADPEIIVGQWQLIGILSKTRRAVALTGLLVLRVRGGYVVHARDFMDGLGVASALGRQPFSPMSGATA